MNIDENEGPKIRNRSSKRKYGLRRPFWAVVHNSDMHGSKRRQKSTRDELEPAWIRAMKISLGQADLILPEFFV
jgi:hypothetical protein